MKITSSLLVGAAALSAAATLNAGEYVSEKVVIEEPLPEPGVSGSVDFSYNSHFMSYGLDVWAAGNSFSDALFNPNVELVFDVGYTDIDLILGTWWDVNDNASSDIGENIQEVDVYVGLAIPLGSASLTVLYQEWYYASDTERILDAIIGFDAPLNPSVVIHGRLDAGGAGPLGGSEGVFIVPGIEPGTDLGPVSLSFPINVGFATDGFHGGDSGFAYASAGASLGYPLEFIPLAGDWAFGISGTFYHTNADVIPNPEENFFTLSSGINVSF